MRLAAQPLFRWAPRSPSAQCGPDTLACPTRELGGQGSSFSNRQGYPRGSTRGVPDTDQTNKFLLRTWKHFFIFRARMDIENNLPWSTYHHPVLCFGVLHQYFLSPFCVSSLPFQCIRPIWLFERGGPLCPRALCVLRSIILRKEMNTQFGDNF